MIKKFFVQNISFFYKNLATVLLGPPFLLLKPKFECSGDIDQNQCEEHVCSLSPHERTFTYEGRNPITREYNLICENDYLAVFVASSLYK